jgi:DNA gyrase/topoisomerase IV subunit B
MESVRQGIKQSLAGIGKDKHHKDIAVSVNEMEVSDGESESTTVASNQTSQDDVDAKSSLTITANNATTSKSTVITKLHEYERLTKVTRIVKKLIVRFDDYDEDFVNEMDIRSYLQYISEERLIHMPRRGSDWDRVLSTAQFFGLQITTFANKIETFVPGAHLSASAALASCQVLLEVCLFIHPSNCPVLTFIDRSQPSQGARAYIHRAL